METLQTLKQKIASLVAFANQLKALNKQLLAEKEHYEAVLTEIKSENAKFAEENAQLLARLDTVEHSALKESAEVEELNQERARTKMAVDDLIKSIDSLVERENQQ